MTRSSHQCRQLRNHPVHRQLSPQPLKGCRGSTEAEQHPPKLNKSQGCCEGSWRVIMLFQLLATANCQYPQVKSCVVMYVASPRQSIKLFTQGNFI